MEEFYEKKINSLKEEGLTKGEYEACQFLGLDLSNADLRDYKFLECDFIDCNLSNAQLTNTSLQDCSFKNCKLLGLSFEDGNDFNFGIRTKGSSLNHSTFYQMNLVNCRFEASSMHSVDFTEAKMNKVPLIECDLLNAQFEQTDLSDCDLSRSFNFNIDPEINSLKGARFSSDQLIGLLGKYQIKISE